jgi:hypothetical protein
VLGVMRLDREPPRRIAGDDLGAALHIADLEVSARRRRGQSVELAR